MRASMEEEEEVGTADRNRFEGKLKRAHFCVCSFSVVSVCLCLGPRGNNPLSSHSGMVEICQIFIVDTRQPNLTFLNGANLGIASIDSWGFELNDARNIFFIFLLGQ
jgi:hypothetical protein